MLENTSGGLGDPAKTERCKPDYEKQINQAKEKLSKAVNLKVALFDYIGNSHQVRDKLAEMIGELVWEERTLINRIDGLIEDQEKDN